jgi:hypothetical protein
VDMSSGSTTTLGSSNEAHLGVGCGRATTMDSTNVVYIHAQQQTVCLSFYLIMTYLFCVTNCIFKLMKSTGGTNEH